MVFLFLIGGIFVYNTNAETCPNVSKDITGTVYCDNKFTLWVNGKKVATDPVEFTPHQAVKVAFKWNGSSSISYAIKCEDFASESGYEYIGSGHPQLGDGPSLPSLMMGWVHRLQLNGKFTLRPLAPLIPAYRQVVQPQILINVS